MAHIEVLNIQSDAVDLVQYDPQVNQELFWPGALAQFENYFGWEFQPAGEPPSSQEALEVMRDIAAAAPFRMAIVYGTLEREKKPDIAAIPVRILFSNDRSPIRITSYEIPTELDMHSIALTSAALISMRSEYPSVPGTILLGKNSTENAKTHPISVSRFVDVHFNNHTLMGQINDLRAIQYRLSYPSTSS